MVNNKANNTNDLNAQYGKLPPQALDVEEAVLGALMLESDAIHQVSDILDSASFYKQEHQQIFEVIKSIAAQGNPIDLKIVTMELKNRGILDKVGGPVYITRLTSQVASAAHIGFHARIIAQKFIQRELIRASSEIQTESYDDTMDMDDLISDARNKINEIDNLVLCSNSGKLSQVVASEALREIEKDCAATRAGISPGIPTGLRELDEATGGWRNTNLIILAARPSVGKSSLALNFAVNAAKRGKWINFYGLEMKNHDYFRILISGTTGLTRTAVRDGVLSDEELERINNNLGEIESLPIIWNDYPGVTANHIRANTIRNKRAGRCDMVIVDYLQLLRPSDKKAIREQQIAEMTRTLKETALSEDIPILALSQLNRDVEKRTDKEPNLSDLRESGAIEQDADVVLFLWDKDSPRMKIGKNRRGTTGYVNFWANPERTAFGDHNPADFDFQTSAGIPAATNFYEQGNAPF